MEQVFESHFSSNYLFLDHLCSRLWYIQLKYNQQNSLVYDIYQLTSYCSIVRNKIFCCFFFPFLISSICYSAVKVVANSWRNAGRQKKKKNNKRQCALVADGVTTNRKFNTFITEWRDEITQYGGDRAGVRGEIARLMGQRSSLRLR